MSIAAAQAAIFYRDVARTRKLWTIRDAGGYPGPKNSRGARAHPFWSSLSRVQRIIKNVAAYHGFEPVELTWDQFRTELLPRLQDLRMEIGINWSGKDAVGYDITIASLLETMAWHFEHLEASA